jgi:hypothetical protein
VTRGARGGCAASAVAVVVLSACSSGTATGSGTSSPTPAFVSTAAPSATTPADQSPARFIGTWQTDALPPATWIAAYRKEGATADQVKDYASQFDGSPAPHRIIVKLTASRWVEYDQHGDTGPEKGWGGDYTVSGSTVRAAETDSQYSCHVVYDVAIDGDDLRIRVVSDEPADAPGCGGDDLVMQRTIYETTAFHRAT